MSFRVYIPYKYEGIFHRYIGRHLFRLQRRMPFRYTFHDNFAHYFWQRLSLVYKILSDNHALGAAQIYYKGPWPNITSLLADGPVISKIPRGNIVRVDDWLPFEPEFNPYVNQLADYLLTKVQAGPALSERITYVRRTTNRKLVNEEHLLASLNRLGLPVHVEEFAESDTRFVEYLNAIQQTRVMVMVHGAAMTNALFLKPGAHFVEINPYGFTFPPLARTLQRRGIITHAIECLPNQYQTGDYRQYYFTETPYPSKPELRMEAHNSGELRVLLRDQENLVAPIHLVEKVIDGIINDRLER